VADSGSLVYFGPARPTSKEAHMKSDGTKLSDKKFVEFVDELNALCVEYDVRIFHVEHDDILVVADDTPRASFLVNGDAD
jgi:hypothetical protein